MLFWCFFFQAEDGIRDIGVTGVQTCALPIFFGGQVFPRQRRAGRRPDSDPAALAQCAKSLPRPPSAAAANASGARKKEFRSGERRVGEEGRSRWSPYH